MMNNLTEINAKIEALEREKAAILAKEKELEVVGKVKRWIEIGAVVESNLGEISIAELERILTNYTTARSASHTRAEAAAIKPAPESQRNIAPPEPEEIEELEELPEEEDLTLIEEPMAEQEEALTLDEFIEREDNNVMTALQALIDDCEDPNSLAELHYKQASFEEEVHKRFKRKAFRVTEGEKFVNEYLRDAENIANRAPMEVGD